MIVDDFAKELHNATRKSKPVGKFIEWADLPFYKKDKKKIEAAYLLTRLSVEQINYVYRNGRE